MAHHKQRTLNKGPRLPFSDKLDQALDVYFLTLGLGVNSYELIQDRRPALKALDDLDDVALFQRGLMRRDIPRRVFKDLFG